MLKICFSCKVFKLIFSNCIFLIHSIFCRRYLLKKYNKNLADRGINFVKGSSRKLSILVVID